MNETTQQAIVQTLREKILSGELSPGQRLVEAQLAQWSPKTTCATRR
ncbi:DNA-binding GntR family transcriptional regulator [Paraburkholderia sp. Clong3]